MKNTDRSERNKSFSPRKTWRKIYKISKNTGIYFPVFYTVFYLGMLDLAGLNAAQKLPYKVFFWVGFVFSALTMTEIFKRHYRFIRQSKKNAPVVKKRQQNKKPSDVYPKLSHTSGNEMNVEYDDRVDYYRFEDGKFLYCGSVKKEKQRQIR